MQKLIVQVILLVGCFLGGKIYAQKEDSLINALKIATHDSSRIKILAELSEVSNKENMLKYAEQGKALSEKGIAAKVEPLRFYLYNLGSSINSIGYFYSQKGDQAKALENYKVALKIFEQINDKKTATYELNNIAMIYDDRGDVAAALEYFYKNLKLQEEIKDTIGTAYSLNNIGYVFMNQQDHKNAMDYYTKSLKMFEVIHYRNGIAMTFANIGIVYTNQSNSAKALEYYNKSLSIYEELDNPYSASNELCSIGFEYAKSGEDTKALEYFNKALKIGEELQIKPTIAYALTAIAKILLRRGAVDSAQQYALRSLKLGKEMGMPKDIQNPAGLLKEIYAKKGNYKDAYAMYDLEIKMKDSVANETNRKAATIKNLQYQYEKKELEIKLDHERKLIKKNILIYASLFGAILIGLLSFFYIRQNKLKTKLERMELEQQQYRSQMNPHFIFNCLNSIQHYIVHNDVIAANKYLSEFASLMRKTLENNQLHTIALQQEIDYLNNYLTLEQMRFENKFTYQISCTPDVNMFDTQILPTIIQPFAENAIVHGLCYLEKDGRLLISFEKEGDYLICKIDDNGIGIVASKELKKQSGKIHDSQGMELIKKRLALASTIYKRKFGVEIIDKTNTEGKASGTLAILKFPIEI